MRLLLFNLTTDADDQVLAFTTQWINALATHYDAIDVITMRKGRLAVAENVMVYSLGKEAGYGEFRRLLNFYRILWRLLRTHRYTACFAHMQPLFATLAAPLLKLYRIPQTLWYAHKSVTLRLKLAEKLVDHVVTANAESFRIDTPKRIITGHGIDIDQFTPTPQPDSDTFTIANIGRLTPIKRTEDLIAAAALLKQHPNLPQIRLLIAGDALTSDRAYVESLKQQAHAANLADQVVFMGAVPFDEIVKVYQEADLVVNLSETGSVDKTVLEAMACERLVMTCNESFHEMLAAWHDLLIVPARAPATVAERIAQVMRLTRDQRAAIAADLRQIVIEKHSLQQLMPRLVKIFNGTP